jgi:hypothetical protein
MLYIGVLLISRALGSLILFVLFVEALDPCLFSICYTFEDTFYIQAGPCKKRICYIGLLLSDVRREAGYIPNSFIVVAYF